MKYPGCTRCQDPARRFNSHAAKTAARIEGFDAMSSGFHGDTWALCDFGGPKSRLLAANAAFWRDRRSSQLPAGKGDPAWQARARDDNLNAGFGAATIDSTSIFLPRSRAAEASRRATRSRQYRRVWDRSASISLGGRRCGQGACQSSGVLMSRGQIEHARIPCRRSSALICCVNPFNPNLDDT